jgi:hypothetical protein
MEVIMALRTTLALVLLCSIAAGCSHPQPVEILRAPPEAAYRTLGMVSGQGENLSTALDAVAIQAERLGADAVVVVSERPTGRVIIVTGRAIRFIAPPPE